MTMKQIPNFEDGNPSDWPTSFSEFKEMEMILGCGICFEYMSTAMVTKCSHNFCSLCIRRYICYKQQCPICLDAVFESDLRNNRIVDEIIQHFTKSRTKLLTLMRSNPDLDQGNSSSNCTEIKETGSTPTSGRLNPVKSLSSPNFSVQAKVTELVFEKRQKEKTDMMSSYLFAGRSKSQSQTNSSTSSLTAQNGDSGCLALDVDNESDVTIHGDPESDLPAQNSNDSDCLFSAKLTNLESNTHPSGYCEAKSSQNDSDCCLLDHLGSISSQSSSNRLEFSSPVSKPLQSATSLSSTTPSGPSSTLFGSGLLSPSTAAVVCPVCNIDVPSRNINLHLDRCLALEQKNDRPIRQNLKRKQMPKLVYTLLSEKDLRKKLSEVGLPSNGNRQVLIKRHHEFTLLYNAQCDSLNPKSAEEIVSEMMQADTLKSVSAAQSTATTNLKLDKTSTSEQVELAQKEYVKKHMSQFKELIKAARREKESASECTDSSTAAEVASSKSEADLASKATIEPSSPSTECYSIEPTIEVTSHGDPEIESNIEESVSLKASTSAELHVSGPSRRIRRKLDQSLSGGTHIPMSGTEGQESASYNHEMPSVAIRRSLRSRANKQKPGLPDSRALADNEDADDSEDVHRNVADDDDDDYEIMPSYSGRKRRAGSSSKVPRPPKTRKPEKVDEQPSNFSPTF